MKRFLGALAAKVLRRPLLLSHEEDADGIISAALYVRVNPRAKVVLAKPQEIRREAKLNWLNWFTWDFVADLPCPRKVKVRVDHHKTNPPCASTEYYDPNAPSAAIMVLKVLGLNADEEARRLAEISVETDTGNIRSEDAWLLNDAVKGADYSSKVKLVYMLAKYGLRALEFKEVKEWIERNRKRREKSIKLIEAIPVRSLTVIEFDEDLDYSYRGMCIELERRGAEVTCIVVPRRRGFKVYLGSRRGSKYDVSAIALKLGGGGHKHAAGAVVKGPDEVYKELKLMTGLKSIEVFEVGKEGIKGVRYI